MLSPSPWAPTPRERCGKKTPRFSRSSCTKPPHFTLLFHRQEFPVSKGLPANTNTKFLFVWAEGRGKSLHRDGRKVAGSGILQPVAVRGSTKNPARSQPGASLRQQQGDPGQFFLSTSSQSHFTYRLSLAPCQTSGGEGRGCQGLSLSGGVLQPRGLPEGLVEKTQLRAAHDSGPDRLRGFGEEPEPPCSPARRKQG